MDKKFSDFTSEFWQNALQKLVLVDGEPDEAIYTRAVALYTAEGGVYEECFNLGALPPKLVAYAGDTLPEDIKTVDERGNFHIPMNGGDDEIKARIWAAYTTPFQKIDQEERNSEGVQIHVSKREQIGQDRGDRPPKNNPKNRSRGMLNILNLLHEMTEEEKAHLPNEIRLTRCFHITESRQNTWGQILDWKEFKKESPEAWRIFLNDRFSENTMQAFSGTGTLIRIDETGNKKEPEKDFPLWKYWLRSLRVMNGLTTPDMSQILGSGGNSYIKIETVVNHGLRLEKAAHLLDKNIFGLPEVTDSDGNTRVDFEYAKRFIGMVGHESLRLEHLKPQLFAAVKAMANAYLRGEITPEKMPSLNELMVLLSHDSLPQGYEIKSGRFIPYPHLAATSALYQLDGVDYTRFFSVMPYYSGKEKKIYPSPSLSPEQAFELAANTAKTLGICLKIYRESIGKSLKEVGENLGITHERVRQLEQAECQIPEFVIQILGDANPYGLPAGDDGKIRADVAEFIREIHIPARRTWGGNRSEK
jgi:hypothetical protein